MSASHSVGDALGPRRVDGGGSVTDGPDARPQVLIVDDDDISTMLLHDILSRSGFEVLVARNGYEALDVLRGGTCRLVITDWELPGMSGVELCRAIREDEFDRYIYAILLTSRDEAHDVVEGLSSGADDFVSKPFQAGELRVRLRAGQRVLGMETRDVAIFAMAKLAESRDPETGAHLERIRNYARILARDLADHHSPRCPVDGDYARLIYLTSPLHDIGKVGIPDSVLLKPGRLSDREFEIMKTHTTLGAETLDAALRQFPGVEFLRMARDIALTHHEHFDGSGYPNGLSGDDIPVAGRIVALADVYDALMSKRVYKDPYHHDVAREIILSSRGRQFDPHVVDAFCRNEAEFIATRMRYSDAFVAAPTPAPTPAASAAGVVPCGTPAAH